MTEVISLKIDDWAPGSWYGIRLDRAVGKNSGVVQGVLYFHAGPKRGLFVRRNAIELVMSQPQKTARPWATLNTSASSRGERGVGGERGRNVEREDNKQSIDSRSVPSSLELQQRMLYQVEEEEEEDFGPSTTFRRAPSSRSSFYFKGTRSRTTRKTGEKKRRKKKEEAKLYLV